MAKRFEPRICPECGKEFTPLRGTQLFCTRVCRLRNQAKRWAKANREKKNAIARAWRKRNKEHYREVCREYYKKVSYPRNREAIIARQRQYVKKNWEKVASYGKAYRLRNKALGMQVKATPFELSTGEKVALTKKFDSSKVYVISTKVGNAVKKYYWKSYIGKKASMTSVCMFDTRKDALKDIESCFA